MTASNDSMKKTSVNNTDEVMYINGREMHVNPDGTLKPVSKKKKAFDAANRRMQDKMAQGHKKDMTLAEFLSQSKQND